jgi:hypothetical protein
LNLLLVGWTTPSFNSFFRFRHAIQF